MDRKRLLLALKNATVWITGSRRYARNPEFASIYPNGKKVHMYSRVKMEISLGRFLGPYEHVHHDDEDTLNDKMYNLKLMPIEDHIKYHGLLRSRECSVEGCNRKHRGKGFCLKHLRRWKNTGSPYCRMKRGHGKREVIFVGV